MHALAWVPGWLCIRLCCYAGCESLVHAIPKPSVGILSRHFAGGRPALDGAAGLCTRCLRRRAHRRTRIAKKRPASVSSRRPKCAPTRQARLGDRRGLRLLQCLENSASNSDVAVRFASFEATPQRRLHRLDRVVPARSRRAANPERGRAAHRRLVACAQSLPWPCGHLLTRGGKQSRHVNRSATPRRKPSRQPMHARLTEPCERSRLCPRSRTALLRAPDCANAVRPSRALTHLSDLPRSASGHSSAKESS